MKNLLKKVAIAAAIMGAVSAANATPIIGVIDLTIGLVQVSASGGFTNIDWNNSVAPTNLNPPPNGATTTTGRFETLAGSSSGSFTVIPDGSIGTVRDMSNNPLETGNYIPIGAGQSILNFLTFSTQPDWQFTLNELVGVGPSPFILTQLGNAVSATISVNGTACDADGDAVCDPLDSKTIWSGVFSTQYPNATIASLTELISNNQALPNRSWSATIEAHAIPEPASIALLGLGLLGLAASRRRTAK